MKDKTMINPGIGKTIKSRRLELGKSIEDIAECAGISVSQLTRVEYGISGHSNQTIHKIYDVLRLNPDTLEPTKEAISSWL